MKKLTEERAPFGGLAGLAWKILLTDLDKMRKARPAPQARSVAESPMVVNWCGTHGKEIDRDFYTYRVFRCPACMQDEIRKAWQDGYNAAIRAAKTRKTQDPKGGKL